MKLKTDIVSLSEMIMKRHSIPETNMKKAIAIQQYMHTVRAAAVENEIEQAMTLMKKITEEGPSFDLDGHNHVEHYELFRTMCGWYADEQFLSVLDRYIEEALKSGKTKDIDSALYHFKRCKLDAYISGRLERILSHAIEHGSLPLLETLKSFISKKDLNPEEVEDDFELRVFAAKIGIKEKKADVWDLLHELGGYRQRSSREHVRILLGAIDRVLKSMTVPELVEYGLMTPKRNYTSSSNYFDKAHEGPAILSIIELMEREEKKKK